MNQLTIVGNLGGDPEMRYLDDGTPVTTFSVAVNRRWTDRDSGEQREKTWWFRVSAWGRQAETCNEYLRTGSQVLVEGRLNPDRETGGPRLYQRNDGSWGAGYEITAERVVFMSTRGSSGGYEGGSNEPMMEDDEIPF